MTRTPRASGVNGLYRPAFPHGPNIRSANRGVYNARASYEGGPRQNYYRHPSMFARDNVLCFDASDASDNVNGMQRDSDMYHCTDNVLRMSAKGLVDGNQKFVIPCYINDQFCHCIRDSGCFVPLIVAQHLVGSEEYIPGKFMHLQGIGSSAGNKVPMAKVSVYSPKFNQSEPVETEAAVCILPDGIEAVIGNTFFSNFAQLSDIIVLRDEHADLRVDSDRTECKQMTDVGAENDTTGVVNDGRTQTADRNETVRGETEGSKSTNGTDLLDNEFCFQQTLDETDEMLTEPDMDSTTSRTLQPDSADTGGKGNRINLTDLAGMQTATQLGVAVDRVDDRCTSQYISNLPAHNAPETETAE